MTCKALNLILLTLGCLSTASAVNNAPGAFSAKPAPLVAEEVPAELKGVGIKQQLGQQLDLSMLVRDESGNLIPFAQLVNGSKPVIVSPVYYNCPRLCNFHLNGLTEGLQKVDWSPGNQFEMIALSFDPKETPDLAKAKKENYMKMYNRPGTEGGWHFLTASSDVIQKFTQQVGFEFKWNEQAKEWAHASAAIVISPDGKIMRYLPGISFDPKDIKLALTEAGRGQVGSLVDSLMLYCFQYDPHKSEYTIAAFRLMKLGGLLTVLVLGIWLGPIWIRSLKAENPRS
jgi:protein SCO1/2